MILLWGFLPHSCFAFLEKDVHLLTMQDGLADNTISSIYKDKEGFIWLGTRNGISRYDGRQITNFEFKNAYPNISEIKEIFDGLLAVISDGVLYAFDLKEERFISVLSSSGELIKTRAVLQKNDSLLWVISGKELLLMKQNRTAEGNLRLELQNNYSGWTDRQTSLVGMTYSSDRRQICLVDEQCRIIILDATNAAPFETVDLGFRDLIEVNSVLYEEGIVWISTIAHGILHYDVKSGKLMELTYSSVPIPTGLTHRDVFKVLRISENKYVAVTWNGYTLLTVDKSDPNEISTELFSNTSSLIHRNLETRMTAAYYDSHGVLWIGTDGGGVIWSDLRMQFYNRFYQERHNEICSILATDDGYIWLATFHGGVMRSHRPFDNSGKIDFSSVGTAEVKKRETVLCGLKDEEGNLWFGNRDGTLTCYHKQRQSFSILPLTTKDGINRHPVWAIFIDSKRRFWIGTQEGLLLLDRANNHCHKLHFGSHEGKDAIASLYVRAIAETADHTLWLGTANYGICRMVDEQTLATGYEEKYGLAEKSVRSLLASSDGNLYVGYMTGFAILSPARDTITRVYTTRDGLCSNFIGCMTEDDKGQIWLGSNSGVSRYSRHQHLFYNYYIAGSNRSVLCKGNTLFWGNNRSLTYFNPDDIKAFAASETVAITRLEVNNKPVEIGKEINGQVILTQGIYYTPAVKLNHANRDFSLIFNNLSYSKSQQKYSYRLRPYQSDWLVADGGEKVSYANLPAGKYVFEVKNIYPDERTSAITSLVVEILPHWSETFIFRMGVFLLALLAVYLIIRRIKVRQKRLEHELQLEHEVFTATIERDKEKQIRMEREKFFTNVAHELRTPLTLILSPLQELLYAVPSSDSIYGKLSMIYRNGESLHTLVDQLLYVQKIEAGMVKLRISKADIVELVKGIILSFDPMAKARGFEFMTDLPHESVWVWIDVAKIASAIRNLLSNAFKYTSPQGQVKVCMKRVERDGTSFCSVVVADTGKGIPKELQERIFDSFITGENTPLLSTKVGIGLRIVKNTMDLHHGLVTLESSPEKGSTFTLLIPEGNTHFEGDKYELIDAPLWKDKSVPLPPVTVAEEKEKGTNRKSLLIIEDHEEVRTYICDLFRKDYIVWEAVNGQEGMEMALDKIPDLIISDVMMPVKDGFMCCKEIREHPRIAHIPILMLTAKAEDVDVLHASKIGVDDYMMKPFNPELLKSKVQSLILQRERLKRIYTKTLMLKQQEKVETTEDGTPSDDFIGQVIHIVEAHLADETFNVKVLADQLNMSQPTLYRKIKQRSELNAIDMIRSVRMSKAASLLMENRYTMQEIAEMVGYNDTRTLRKHFTEQFGVSPSKYMGKE